MEGRAMDTLPEGWRMVEAELGGPTIGAPSGEQFPSRLEALEGLVRQGRGQKVLREMRMAMVEVEGWQESSLLPDGWIYKVMRRGKSFRSSGILWSSEVTYSTREGATLASVMTVKKYMEDSSRCNFEDLTNYQAFLREDGTTAAELLGQVRDSVEVAPWGLKKYKSNQKPGCKVPAGRAACRKVSSIKEPWTDGYDSDEETKTEKDEKPIETSVVKPKKEYIPFTFEMRTTLNAKSARRTINMTRAARRPCVRIVDDVEESSRSVQKVKSSDTSVKPEEPVAKRKFDQITQSYPDLKITHPREDAVIKNIVKSKRLKLARHIG